MLKYILYILLAIVVLSLVAGGIHLYRVSAKNKAEMASFTGPKIGYHNNLGKSLVIYYSLSGHTKDIADRISMLTDADVYEIKTEQPLKNGPLFALKMKKQLWSKEYPKLVQDFPDAANYDTIFVGAPIWWYIKTLLLQQKMPEYKKALHLIICRKNMMMPLITKLRYGLIVSNG